MFVEICAELFAATLSIPSPVTETVATCVPAVAADPLTVNVALTPGCNVPSWHSMPFAETMHMPFETLKFICVMPAGTYETVTPVAVLGPELVMVAM